MTVTKYRCHCGYESERADGFLALIDSGDSVTFAPALNLREPAELVCGATCLMKRQSAMLARWMREARTAA